MRNRLSIKHVLFCELFVVSHVQSIQRAMAILRSFTEAEPELGVTTLSRRLGLHKSTVSRILSTLQYEGLVGQNQDTGKYRLGAGLISLAGVALGRLDVRGVAAPYMDTLLRASQETISLSILDGSESVTIDRATSLRPIRYVGWIGRRLPLHSTASGKVFLTYMSPEMRDAILPLPLVKYTERTIVKRELLEQSLAEICREGYAIVHEEFEEGFSAMAAPVYNHTNRVTATVDIAGPTFRMATQAEAFVAPMLDAAHMISAELGYVEP